MCHGYDPREHAWHEESIEAETDEEEADPAFFDDEPAEDVEILTDGGEGDEE